MTIRLVVASGHSGDVDCTKLDRIQAGFGWLDRHGFAILLGKGMT